MLSADVFEFANRLADFGLKVSPPLGEDLHAEFERRVTNEVPRPPAVLREDSARSSLCRANARARTLRTLWERVDNRRRYRDACL